MKMIIVTATLLKADGKPAVSKGLSLELCHTSDGKWRPLQHQKTTSTGNIIFRLPMQKINQHYAPLVRLSSDGQAVAEGGNLSYNNFSSTLICQFGNIALPSVVVKARPIGVVGSRNLATSNLKTARSSLVRPPIVGNVEDSTLTGRGTIDSPDQATVDFNAERTSLLADIAAYQKDLTTKENQLTQLRNTVTSSKSQVATLSAEAEGYRNNLNARETELTQSQDRAASLELQIETLNNDKLTDAANRESLLAEIDIYKNDLTRKEDELTQSRDQITSLELQVATLNEAELINMKIKESLLADIALYKNNLTTKENELTYSRDKITSLESQVATLSSENEALARQNTAVTSPITAIAANIGSQIYQANENLKDKANPYKVGNIQVELHGALSDDGNSMTLWNLADIKGGGTDKGSVVTLDIEENTTAGAVDNTIVIPDVTGLTESVVKRLLASIGLKLDSVARSVSEHSELTIGQSISQAPAASTAVSKGATVLVVFATP